MTKLIPLTKGQFAIVDDEDFEWLTQWKWYWHNSGYAIRSIGNQKVYMHKALLDVGPEMEVDHINRNKLDNRRQNLRKCTRQQNCWNIGKSKGTTSQYKGVTWNKRLNKWQAQTMANQKMIYLGLFVSEVDAAKAYDAAAREYFGDFALTNFLESE